MVKPEELLLLYAILEKNDSMALAYFTQWTQTVDFSNVEGGSFRLLPLLYKRVAKIGQPIPHLNRLKGIYRQSLYTNSMLFHKAFAVLAELEKMGVPIILLKGTALIVAYYEDIGARPMTDVDLLVPEKDVERTLRFLKEQGWHSSHGLSLNKAAKHIHSHHLQSPDGYELDVHWRVFYQCSWDEADLTLWEQTETVSFKGVNIKILNPTLQILHNCSHGVRWNLLSSIRWIVDLLKIIEKRANSIDWELLVSEAAERKLTVTMLHALSFLNSKFNAGIPEEVLNSLAALRKDSQELRLFEILTSPPRFGDMSHKWLIHSYGLGPAPFWKKATLFPDFLKNAWELQALYQLPFYVLKRIIQKIAQHHPA
jgi:Uncharacterised nucleotidyltransferase